MKTLARIGMAVVACCWSTALVAQSVTLPNRKGSQKFLVIGDAGTGDKEQYAVAGMITKVHALFPFDFAIMLGDNMYGGERPQDFANKFELPYKALLDDKVEFNAALGNHDDPNERFYKLFNMGGERYRTFKKGNIRFFILDSNYLDPDQVKWLEKELSASGSDWKIAYFHHPIYTTASRGPELENRKILEPLFIKYGIDVVFSGHEHVYERIRIQNGIHYFTAGGAAKLNTDDTHVSDVTEVGFATDRSFMIVEVAGDSLFFQAISGGGSTIDKGLIARHLGADPKVVATTPSGTSTIVPAAASSTTVVKTPTPVKKAPPKAVVKKTTTTTKTPAKTTTKTTTTKPGTPVKTTTKTTTPAKPKTTTKPTRQAKPVPTTKPVTPPPREGAGAVAHL